MKRLLVVLALLLTLVARGSEVDDRARAVGATLKCPVCNGLPITESPSEFARSMYAEVRSQVEKGRSPDEIKAFFVSRYGNSVLLEPPFSGVTLFVWLMPVAAISLGAWGLTNYLRRASKRREAEGVDPELLERVRALRKTP
jgi:cytochrome c-type biogenesis protein CcmH